MTPDQARQRAYEDQRAAWRREIGFDAPLEKPEPATQEPDEPEGMSA